MANDQNFNHDYNFGVNLRISDEKRIEHPFISQQLKLTVIRYLKSTLPWKHFKYDLLNTRI